MKTLGFFCLSTVAVLSVSCEVTDNTVVVPEDEKEQIEIGLGDVAQILAQIPLEPSHLDEVYEAVSSSSTNGYDEEYTMRHLFTSPGAGVGDKETRSGKAYSKPLREMIEQQVRSMSATKSGSLDPDGFLDALMESDVQIYWPFSEEWNGEQMPLITFDPEDGADKNIGYRFVIEDDGSRHVEEVVVDEEMAMEVPVWVVNRNTDAGYTSLEMLRREDPEWGEGGGSIIVNPKRSSSQTTRADKKMKSLVLKDFTMNRSYDSWFAGASEFFVLTIIRRCSFV